MQNRRLFVMGLPQSNKHAALAATGIQTNLDGKDVHCTATVFCSYEGPTTCISSSIAKTLFFDSPVEVRENPSWTKSSSNPGWKKTDWLKAIDTFINACDSGIKIVVLPCELASAYPGYFAIQSRLDVPMELQKKFQNLGPGDIVMIDYRDSSFKFIPFPELSTL